MKVIKGSNIFRSTIKTSLFYFFIFALDCDNETESREDENETGSLKILKPVAKI